MNQCSVAGTTWATAHVIDLTQNGVMVFAFLRAIRRSDRSAQRSDYRVWLALASPCCNQTSQTLRDDLPRLFDQLVNNLTGGLDLADQAHALTR